MCSTEQSSAAQQPAPSLTTEYTPRERGSVAKTPAQPSTPSATAPPPSSSTPVPTSATEQKPSAFTDGVDPSTLPVATAPPSHPHIDPDVPGTLDGRSVLEVDLSALQDKGWRRPGSDLSDWFNYGFDEVSWEAYCYRRRDLGELANVLKANVLVRTPLQYLILNAIYFHHSPCADRLARRTLLGYQRTSSPLCRRKFVKWSWRAHPLCWAEEMAILAQLR